MRGVFPVLQSPFDDVDRLDLDALAAEVEFCRRAGVHGVVYPAIASEFQYLTDDERRAGVEAVVIAAAGAVPVVAGVASASGAQAAVYAEHAAQAGASAVMALPPILSPGRPDELRAYYAGIAKAAGLPLFVQHSQAGMDAEFLAGLVRDIESMHYIKEEMHPSAHYISGVLEALPEGSVGVFGGYYGRWMLSELARGATGFMPAADTVDVHVQVWDAWQRGRHRRRARDLQPSAAAHQPVGAAGNAAAEGSAGAAGRLRVGAHAPAGRAPARRPRSRRAGRDPGDLQPLLRA